MCTQATIYDEMVDRNRKLIGNEGYTWQPKLKQYLYPEECYAIYSLVDPLSISEHYQNLMSTLQDSEAVFPYVPYDDVHAGRLHWTIMQLLTFGHIHLLHGLQDRFEQIVTGALQRLLPVNIEFTRTCVLRGSIVALGFADKDVNVWREALRTELLESGLPIVEPYKADIVHVTLGRFSGPVTDLNLESVEAPLFTARVLQATLAPATWRLMRHERSDAGKQVSVTG